MSIPEALTTLTTCPKRPQKRGGQHNYQIGPTQNPEGSPEGCCPIQLLTHNLPLHNLETPVGGLDRHTHGSTHEIGPERDRKEEQGNTAPAAE